MEPQCPHLANWGTVGRIADIHVLIPRTCEYKLYSKEGIKGQMELRPIIRGPKNREVSLDCPAGVPVQS